MATLKGINHKTKINIINTPATGILEVIFDNKNVSVVLTLESWMSTVLKVTKGKAYKHDIDCELKEIDTLKNYDLTSVNNFLDKYLKE